GENVTEFKELWVRPLGLVLALLGAVLSVQLINPNGCKVLWFPISQFSSPFWQAVTLEYHPPALGEYKLLFLSIAGVVVLQAITWRRLNPRLFFGSIVFGYLACHSQRSLLFFVIMAMPHLAYMLSVLRNTFSQAGREGWAGEVAWLFGAIVGTRP